MRTLFITRWRPHKPQGGAQMRNAQNIYAASKCGEVDVLSIGVDAEKTESVQYVSNWIHLKVDTQKRPSKLDFLAPYYHPITQRYKDVHCAEQLKRLLDSQQYDLVIVEELCLASYVEVIQRKGTKVVFDAHNVEAKLRTDIQQSVSRSIARRFKEKILNWRLLKLEKRVFSHVDQVWVCSKIDRDVTLEYYKLSTPIIIVPNTVNTTTYQKLIRNQTQTTNKAQINLIYIGTMSYLPNEKAALELIQNILPRLRSCGRAANLTIIGRSPSKLLKESADRDVNVELTGTVESIFKYFEKPAILVLPITEGSGTRLKILEAFAMRCAVICTKKAAEGIEVTHGNNVQIAETTVDFSNLIQKVWDSDELRSSQTLAALSLVRKEYSWGKSAELITKTLDERQ